jgi:hypothetical protein
MKTKGKPGAKWGCFLRLALSFVLCAVIGILLIIIVFRENDRYTEETFQLALNRECPGNTLEVSKGYFSYDPMTRWSLDRTTCRMLGGQIECSCGD